MPSDPPEPSASQQPALPPASRGFLVFVVITVVFVMVDASTRAHDRLTAFGLTCVTVSALLVAPQLLTSMVSGMPLERLLAKRTVARASNAIVRGWALLIGPAQSALIFGGWVTKERTSHQTLGLLMFVAGIVLMVLLLFANALFWATWRSVPTSGRPVDLVRLHTMTLERYLGPNWTWIIAGLLFIVGTVLQFLATL